MTDKILKKLYYDPSQGFISAEKLHKKIEGVSREEIDDFISNQKVSQVYGRSKIKYPPIRADHPRQMYQIDLMFYENLKPFNDQRGVFLNVIDIYSRKAWSIPLTNKTAKSVAEAFSEVLKDGIPEQVQSDHGSEFKGSFKKLLKDHNIKQIFVEPGDKTKQGVIERFNGTLRDKIDRYRAARNTNRFIGVLQSLIDNYNNTHHRTIKTSPQNAWEGSVIPANIIENQIKKEETESIIDRFKIGDDVRVLNKSKSRKGNPIEQSFTKGRRKFSEKVYKIEKIENYHIFVHGKDTPYKFYEVKVVDTTEEDPNKQESRKPVQKIQHKPGDIERKVLRPRKDIDYATLSKRGW